MLTVSRSDIDTEAITEFPANSRFIRLPISKYLQLLGIHDTMNRPQIALINAINNPNYRFVCAALARRLGKTYIANVIAQLVALIPETNVLIISPNYNLSSISFELQRRFIKHFDLEISRDNMKDKLIELANGSSIRMGSLSTVDACVGRSYKLILFDEAALGSDGEAAFNVQLRPTLDTTNSKAIFISTPRGKNNWFSKFFERGFSDSFGQWCSIHADYSENVRMSESDVEEAKRSMSKAEFEQEYLANFTTFEGQIFKTREDTVCNFDLPRKEVEIIGGLDPGYRDPTAFVVVAYRDEEYWVIDEYQAAEKTTEEHAAEIKKLVDKYGIETIFIDSAAAQFAADLAYNYDISCTKARKDVLPGIAFVQTLVETGRLKVSPSCTRTLKMLDQYKWDNGTTLVKEKPLHDEYSHMADALRYAVYSLVT